MAPSFRDVLVAASRQEPIARVDYTSSPISIIVWKVHNTSEYFLLKYAMDESITERSGDREAHTM